MTRNWIRLSYFYAARVAFSLGYFLLRIPIQVSDSFTNILVLDRSLGSLMWETAVQPGYLRPGLWAELKVVYDLSGGDYSQWYRWTQVLQVAIVLALFVRLLRPGTRAAAAAVPLTLAVLVGSHTFAWTVREAFPINTFLTIVVCCVAAANLALTERRAWHDAAALALTVVAALTVESGLLVPVIFVVAFMVGARGVSGRAVAAVMLLVLVYFVARFTIFSVGMPPLDARDAGYGFSRRNAADIAAMFGARPFVLYAYNVVSSLLGVLFAEPRDGVWRLTASLIAGRPNPVLVIGAVSSTLATALIARFAWRRRARWLSRALDRDDQIVLLFIAVLMANAAISYAYTKDVIMSPAGVFFAAAFFVACRDLFDGLPGATRLRTLTATIALAVLSTTWAVRQVGLHAGLARTSVQVREHWAYIDDWLTAWGYRELPPRVAALRQRLQDDAVVRQRPPMPLGDRWTRFFEVE